MRVSKFGEPDNRPWCDGCGDRVDHLHGWGPYSDVDVLNLCDNCYKLKTGTWGMGIR